MKVRFLTLGCKVNQYETEAMRERLEGRGFAAAGDNEPADVLIVNSCTVTAQSDQKARQALRRLKRQNPDAVTVLTGCWPQAFPHEVEKLMEADIILGNSKRGELADRIMEYLSTKQRIVDVAPHTKGEPFEPMSVRGLSGHTRAFLKIEDGCERYCAYCIIPYARGHVRSKPMGDIRAEVAGLSERGYKEVVLTGINLPAYGQDLGITLCDAVEAACSVEGISRVRLGSLEPERLTPEVIERMKRQDKLCPQFHLSLQSGSNAVLKAMNRHYTREEYLEKCKKVYEYFPSAAITTDVIAGFPTETEEDFIQSLRMIEEAEFARVHAFGYSPREGTAAFKMKQLPAEVKSERLHRLISAAEKAAHKYADKFTGTAQEIIAEEYSDGYTYGYTGNYIRAYVSGRLASGEKYKVILKERFKDGVTAKLYE